MVVKGNFTAPLGIRPSRITAAMLMGTVLVGCTAPGSGPGASRYEPTYLRLTEERQFSEALRQHYLELATNAYDRGDTARSDFYSLRALMAAEGKLARPGDVSRHAGTGEEGAAAGRRLRQALSTGARTGSPDLAARAQAAYDCWLLESGPDGDPQIAQSCRFNAMNALAQLESAGTGARLVTSGGPVLPQGASYTVEAGAPSQTINAPGGYTIQIITEQVAAPQYHAPMAVQHSTIEAPAVQYATQAAPSMRYVQTEPMMQAVPATTRYVETAPAMSIQSAPPVAQADHSFDVGFEPLTTVALDTAPVMQEAPMTYEQGPMEYNPAPMTTYDSSTVAYEPINYEIAPLAPMSAVPAVDLGPIEATPVFNTEPVQSMPIVEMAAIPMTNDGSVNALIEASANQSGDFSVFFGFDSDEVTLEGEDVLIDTVERVRLSGASRVTLMGFTDSVGDARYNQLLAMRRAQSVRKYLQGKLGTGVAFEILPVGEVQAVKNGGDGVKEALNRKVEIGLW